MNEVPYTVHNCKIYLAPTETLKNKYIYVNQNVSKPSRVLINPNFKPTIHINPNFNPGLNNLNPYKPSIHINPEVLNCNGKTTTGICNIQTKSHDTPKAIKYITCNNNKKLIRTSLLIGNKNSFNNTTSKTCIVKANLNKFKTSPNKFKIDRRKKEQRKLPMKQKGTCSISTRYIFIKNAKLNTTKYVKVNGKLYKYSGNKSPVSPLVKTNVPNKKRSLLFIKQKLALRKYNKVCNVNKNIYKFVLKDSGKNNESEKKTRSKKLSIRKQNISKLKKCNLPCKIYQKYGKCAKMERGKCLKLHNPDQIALCAKFLRGECQEKNCLLSHNLLPEKMPTCNYYLEGRCFKDDCPYLHVKVSAKADICKNFLEGFCKLGKECERRHQYLCPDYEKNNVCPKVKCPYPHGNLVRNIDLLRRVAKRTKCKEESAKEEIIVEGGDKNNRYYVNNSDTEKEHNPVCENETVIERKKLGLLPPYIPFENVS